MKATVTIEIEGSKAEIDSITNKLSKFVGRQKQTIRMNPIKDMYPKRRGYLPKNPAWKRGW